MHAPRPILALRPAAALLAAAVLVASSVGVVGAVDPTRTFVPIGSDYQPDTLERFALAAVEHDTSGHVLILVLPITYGTDAFRTTNGERKQNLTFADRRRGQVETACNVVKRVDQTCEAQLVPTLVRSDAYLPANLAYFTPDVDGLYILGGDQTVAMGVTAGTPLEERMAAAYLAGAVVGGNSAGDAVQSVNMINGFVGDNGPAEGLREGAVDLWLSEGVNDPSRGLIFGLANAIDEQHVYERGRIGRAINVAFSAGLPVIGMDAATGGAIVDESMLTDVVGFTSGIVLDPLTWAAEGAFRGPTSTLSIRGLATHLVPPGGFGYDLVARRPTVGGVGAAAPSIAGRAYPSFATPAGAGPLFLSGGIVGDPAGTAGKAFIDAAGGSGGRIVVLAAGYARSTDAMHDAKAIAAALEPGLFAPVGWFVLDGKTDVAAAAAAVGDATGIVLTAPDPSRVGAALAAQVGVVEAIEARWTSGAAALLADDAAAAAMGARFVADPLPADIETESSEDFLVSGVAVASGLGWVDGLVVASRLLPGQAWGDLYQLVATEPATLGVGIDVGTAIEVGAGAATTHGDGAAVVLDGRSAAFGLGSNGALAARWIVLDSFTDGEDLAP